MKESHRIINALILVVALIVFIFGAVNLAWFFSAASRGQRAAQSDVQQGSYVFLDVGLRTSERYDVADLLQKRYGIELRFLAERRVSRTLAAYVRGYNKVVAAAAQAKFGRDVYKECALEAHRATLDLSQ